MTTLLVLLDVGMVSLAALLCGYAFEAIMFPTIFALSLRGLGNHTKRASSFLMMSPVGGVVGPLLMGLVADHTTMVWAFIVRWLPIAWCGHMPQDGVRLYRFFNIEGSLRLRQGLSVR